MSQSWLKNSVVWPVLPFAVREVILKSQLAYWQWQIVTSVERSRNRSQIGGLPYWLNSKDYPRNKNGKYMSFLAQICLDHISDCDLLPQKGMLLFFLDPDYQSFDTNDLAQGQLATKVVFQPTWPEKGQPGIVDFSFLPTHAMDFPLDPDAGYFWRPQYQWEIAGPLDYRFFLIHGRDFFSQFGENQDEIWDALFDMADNTGHKTGGYAHFTQQDPRPEREEWLLLLQVDSDEAIRCKWGDCGLAHFFIRKNDLQRADFSNVWFHWDTP